MDAQRLKENFALVGEHGDDVIVYFYDDLFARAPEARAMFPDDMARQREMLLAALSQIVSAVDDTDVLVPFLEKLGKHHKGLGVQAEHYPLVGASLLATLQHFSGPAWTPDIEGDWAAAYGVVSQVMMS